MGSISHAASVPMSWPDRILLIESIVLLGGVVGLIVFKQSQHVQQNPLLNKQITYLIAIAGSLETILVIVLANTLFMNPFFKELEHCVTTSTPKEMKSLLMQTYQGYLKSPKEKDLSWEVPNTCRVAKPADPKREPPVLFCDEKPPLVFPFSEATKRDIYAIPIPIQDDRVINSAFIEDSPCLFHRLCRAMFMLGIMTHKNITIPPSSVLCVRHCYLTLDWCSESSKWNTKKEWYPYADNTQDHSSDLTLMLYPDCDDLYPTLESLFSTIPQESRLHLTLPEQKNKEDTLPMVSMAMWCSQLYDLPISLYGKHYDENEDYFRTSYQALSCRSFSSEEGVAHHNSSWFKEKAEDLKKLKLRLEDLKQLISKTDLNQRITQLEQRVTQLASTER